MSEQNKGERAPRSHWAGLSNRALALDLVERLIVCAWYGTFAVRFLHKFIATFDWTKPLAEMLLHIDWTMLLLVISEGTVIAFTLFRRPAATISLKPVDWLLAMGGTVLPLCAQPESGAAALLPLFVCVLIMIAGFSFQIWAKFTLRKRFGIVAANRGVQARGPYGLVRHPMYAGYTLTEIGFFLAHPSLWNAAVYSGALMFQVLRILAEERYLSRDPAYLELKDRVRWRLVPGVF